VSRVIPVRSGAVWDRLRDIGSHVEWMADAEAIRFTGERRAGVGTTFDCDTKVGPVRLVDRMEVTEWQPGRAMGVRHRGVVTGTGRFTIRPLRLRRATRLTWEEELRFPWWLGGPVGALGGRLVLRALWRGNLRRLDGILTGAGDGVSPERARRGARRRGRARHRGA
jgi:hypothetical protein